MAFDTIALGTNPNDGTGDTLRNAFDKVNDNFAKVAEELPISADVTISVPGDYATIALLMTYLNSKRIAPGVAVTVDFDDGTYSHTGTSLNHPQGAQIFFVGNVSTPANVTLVTTSGTVDAFTVSNGHVIGGFNGFRLSNTGTKGGTGILALGGGSHFKCGPNLEVDNYYYGIAGRNGGVVNCDGTSSSNRVIVSNAGDVGIWAFVGGAVSCRYAKVDTAIDLANSLGYGIMAEYGGSIDCQYAKATACYKGGIAAFSGGVTRAYNTETYSNTGDGYSVNNGTLIAHSGSSHDNTGLGAKGVGTSAALEASPAITYASNTGGDYYRAQIAVQQSTGRFGVGISTPSCTFEAFSDTSDAVVKARSTYADAAVALDAKDNTKFSYVQFLRGATERGRIQYDHANDRLTYNATTEQRFQIGGTAKAYVNSTGFGVGGAATQLFEVISSAADAVAQVSSSFGSSYVNLNAKDTTLYSIILFKAGGTEYGRIQYDHTNAAIDITATGKVNIKTAATTRLVIDSSGILDYKQAAVTAGAPFTNTGKIPIKINGVSYNLMLCA